LTKVAVAVEGWNAEAAVGFALAARKFASSVTLTSNRETVDGKDEIEVMTLGPERGEEVLLAVDGRDEKEAFDTLLAGLLGVIEPHKNRLTTVIGTEAARGRESTKPPRRRIAEIAALDVEEVAPARMYSKRMPTGQFRRVGPRQKDEHVRCYNRDPCPPPNDRLSTRRGKKRVNQKQSRKGKQKPTTTRRKPRKRKK
jgi:phosphotransferase system HPr (HPr) family protein